MTRNAPPPSWNGETTVVRCERCGKHLEVARLSVDRDRTGYCPGLDGDGHMVRLSRVTGPVTTIP